MDTSKLLYVCANGCGSFELDEMVHAPESEKREYYSTDPSYVCPKCGHDKWYLSIDE